MTYVPLQGYIYRWIRCFPWSSICFLHLSHVLWLTCMAPKHHARGGYGVSAMCGVASRGCRGRGACALRAARTRRGSGGSSGSFPAEAGDMGALSYDFVLYILGLLSRRIALPSSFTAVISEQGLDGLCLRAQGYLYCPL